MTDTGRQSVAVECGSAQNLIEPDWRSLGTETARFKKCKLCRQSRLNRFLNDCGIVDPRKVVHSLRHRAQDRLRAAGCPHDLRWALLGHEGKTVAAGYGEGFPVRILKEWIDKIGFLPTAVSRKAGARGRGSGVFRVPTVFVIGAGAGSDIGMPVGSTLSDAIARKLDFFYEMGELRRGDGAIAKALRRLAKERNANFNEWVAAGRSVANGIRYTRSIDSYINTHRDDEKIKDCAKLAIVQAILESEKNAAVYWNNKTNDWNRPEEVGASWLHILMYLLQDKIVKGDNFGDLFANITIINFNYDRCIEQFLYHAVQQLYRLNSHGAAEAINSWNRIYHPYGSVGVLPWQAEGRQIDFGVTDYGDISGLSQEIFTYNEQMTGAGSLDEIRQAITNARRIVFLGFHFHQQNMDLLQTNAAGGPVNVYATVLDRSAPERIIIERQIIVMLKPERQRHNVDLLHNMKCTDLLNQYGTTLLQ